MRQAGYAALSFMARVRRDQIQHEILNVLGMLRGFVEFFARRHGFE
jgi:hypothetical protein